MVVILVSFIGVFSIGFVVFGGGQVFMPLFKWLWNAMDYLGANISDEQIDQIFTIANSTPGVMSGKLAIITSYLATNEAWFSWMVWIATYLVFLIPAIIAILYASKLVSKLESLKPLQNITVFLKPAIGGVVMALGLQILINTAFPTLVFNDLEQYTGHTGTIFSGWRLYVLPIYAFIVTIETAYLYYKRVNLFLLVLVHLIVGLVLFQPWTM